MRCVLPSADSKRLETVERDERHFKLIIALVCLTVPHSSTGTRQCEGVYWELVGRVALKGGAGVEFGSASCYEAWRSVFTLLKRNVQINCVKGDWTDVWSNTVMMQENFNLKRTLNYNFKGKRNVGRTKNDLQLRSGENETSYLACCAQEVRNFTLGKYGRSHRVTEGWPVGTGISFSCHSVCWLLKATFNMSAETRSERRGQWIREQEGGRSKRGNYLILKTLLSLKGCTDRAANRRRGN